MIIRYVKDKILYLKLKIESNLKILCILSYFAKIIFLTDL